MTTLLAVAASSVFRLSAEEPTQNIVVNGSFEEPEIAGLWEYLPDSGVPGWSSITPGVPIEIMRGDKGPAIDGFQYIELDSDTQVVPKGVYQNLETIPGTIYRVTFAFAPRPGSPASDNSMNVNWGAAGGTVSTALSVSADGTDLTEAAWQYRQILVRATSEVSRLEFAYSGNVNSFGLLLDDVAVTPSSCETVFTGGPWSDPLTWSCDGFPHGFGSPGAGNDASITAGTTVNLTRDESVNNITISGTLDNTAGHKLTVYGDWTQDGDYLIGSDGNDIVEFSGKKEQKVKGSKDPVFNNVLVSKQEKQQQVEFERDLKIQKKLQILKGKARVGDADFNDVDIEEDGELIGSPEKTKTYLGDKKIDGLYTHNQSKDKFIGSFNQKITSSSEEKQQLKIEYYLLQIEKENRPLALPSDPPQKSTAEFEKDTNVKTKTEILSGEGKFGNAEFEDDVEVKEDGKLSGTAGKTKEYYKNKIIDGEYEHNESLDKFKGSEDSIVSSKEELLDLKLLYYQLQIEKEQQQKTEFLKSIEVEQKTEIDKGEMKTHDADFKGDVDVKEEAKLSGTQDYTQSFYKDKKIDGVYEHNQSKAEFQGELDQTIGGDSSKQDKLEYYQLLIKKQEESQALFDKHLLLKEKMEIEEGKAKVGDATFEGDVEIKQEGELEGTQDKTKTYYGDKTVDGKYTHNESVDEFNGDKFQTIAGSSLKQSKLEYYQLLIKKQEEQKAEFEKELLIKQKMEIEEGIAKLKENAQFEGDVEIKEQGELEGEQGKTKTYFGDKTIDGTYTHNLSKDLFTGSKEEQKLQGTSETKYYELELEKSKQDDLLDAMLKLQVEYQLKLILGTFKTNTIFEDVIIEQGGHLILGEGDDPTQVRGNWTNNGEFDANDGTVIFNGENQTIGGSNTTTFVNLEIQSNTTVNTTIKVDGTLKLDGTLTLGDGVKIEQGDGFTIEGEGSLEVTTPVSLGPITGAPTGPIPVGTEVNVQAEFSNDGLLDEHVGLWSWGDGTDPSDGAVTFLFGEGTVDGSHIYSEPGVYTISLTVTPNEDDDRSDSAVYQFVVVFDPDGGFVTGGGWIDSPAGAYVADPELTGKANFGFVSRYQRGANVPTGNTQFEFKAGNLEFKSTEYEWLVIAGARAQFKGSGTINGQGDFGFMLVGIDGSINGSGGENKFRIKIWDKADGDAVVYDNQHGASDDSSAATVLGGGNIQIHQPPGGGGGQGNGGGRGND